MATAARRFHIQGFRLFGCALCHLAGNNLAHHVWLARLKICDQYCYARVSIAKIHRMLSLTNGVTRRSGQRQPLVHDPYVHYHHKYRGMYCGGPLKNRVAHLRTVYSPYP